MVQQIRLFTTSIGRFAFPFSPEVVCTLIPRKILVQRGRYNPPVKKGSKAYYKSFLPFCLLPPYLCLLALGTYLLMKHGTPIYIGRSDHCLQKRLSSHPLLTYASHFVWEACPSPFQAFCLESFWFHRLQNQPQLLNIIHPARPVGFEALCPFCNIKDIKALGIALGKPL